MTMTLKKKDILSLNHPIAFQVKKFRYALWWSILVKVSARLPDLFL